MSSGFGGRLKATLDERGMSQQQLEKAAGTSRGYVSRLVRGERGENISAGQLKALAAALQVDADWLKSGEEQKKAPEAMPHPTPPPDSHVSSDPCPCRTLAAELSIEDRVPPWAIARVMAAPIDNTRSTLSWAREMRAVWERQTATPPAGLPAVRRPAAAESGEHKKPPT